VLLRQAVFQHVKTRAAVPRAGDDQLAVLGNAQLVFDAGNEPRGIEDRDKGRAIAKGGLGDDGALVPNDDNGTASPKLMMRNLAI
jgi:hypothetical protein